MYYNKMKEKFHTVFSDKRGFSLLEIIVVIVIIGVLASMAVKSVSNQAERRRFEATLAEMEALKFALIGDPDRVSDGIRTDFGFVGDMGALPTNPNQLVLDPGWGSWNGPYMEVNFQEDPNDYLNDEYGQAYVFSAVNLTIYSPGANATIKIVDSVADLLTNTVRLFVTDRDGFTPKAADLVNISVVISLQSGGTINGTVLAGGICTVNNVPIGNHVVSVSHAVLSETIPKRLSVNPGQSPAPLEIIFSSLP